MHLEGQGQARGWFVRVFDEVSSRSSRGAGRVLGPLASRWRSSSAAVALALISAGLAGLRLASFCDLSDVAMSSIDVNVVSEATSLLLRTLHAARALLHPLISSESVEATVAQPVLPHHEQSAMSAVRIGVWNGRMVLLSLSSSLSSSKLLFSWSRWSVTRSATLSESPSLTRFRFRCGQCPRRRCGLDR